MNSFELYQHSCNRCSELITKKYSTSFSLGIRVFDKEFRNPIYSIYGFVRFADEIVDTFHDFDKKLLLGDFRKETLKAIEHRISLNPILQSFQQAVNTYQIDHQLIAWACKFHEGQPGLLQRHPDQGIAGHSAAPVGAVAQEIEAQQIVDDALLQLVRIR